ncbi:MAG: ABC transporter permease [Dysgonamonadaceae bacterium]|jgi:putative ABC transport system permease protein|nr:ABC transporter permease [Dysgonamonadaceae bacterium]
MREIIKEIIASIQQHKARSILTGFGIAWGMFILIVLLGAGNGFRNGMLIMFSGYASNSIWVTGQQVSQAKAGGVQSGSRVHFNESVADKLQKRFPQIKSISSEISMENANPVGYKGYTGYFDVKGIDSKYNTVKLLEIEEGRFLNELDYKELRRVAVIGDRVKETLFKNENPVGKHISIAGVFFQVVGVLKAGTLFSMMEQSNIYIPVVSLYHTFNLAKEFPTFGALLHEKTDVETFETELRNFLAQEIGFDKNDRRALFINNIQLQVAAFNSLFNGIDIFLWVLGICFLLSGMIGITNIMLVVVKERTTEIGIRKALGATPESIIFLIVSEALIITVLFGLIGLLSGYMGMGVYNWVVSALQTGQPEIFAQASLKGYIVVSAFMLLIISGVVAGLFPAQKAAKIMPVETLNKAI